MASLNELANKLQTFIIEQQVDPHNLRQLNIHKYNNLKLKIAQLSYPNVVICIGISEATYNLEDGTKVDGGLGQDERYVLKWLRKGPVIDSLKHLYYELTDLVSLEEEVLMEKQDLEAAADEAKIDIRTTKRKVKLPKDSPLQEFEYDPKSEEKVKEEYEQSINNPAIPKLQRYEEASDLEVYKGPGLLKTLQEAIAVFDLNEFLAGKYKSSKKKNSKKDNDDDEE